MTAEYLSQPRAKGQVRLSTKAVGGRSVLDDLRQSGSLKLLFPRTDGPLQGVLVNTAGGVTGGDAFSTDIAVSAGTALTLTTQAAERAYRAQKGQTGTISTCLEIGDGARLNWLPQETILFEGCSVQRRLSVDLAATAALTLVEPLVFGRTAMGEAVRQAFFSDRIDIRRAGAPLYLDAFRFDGDLTAHLAGANTGAGAGAMVTLIHVSDQAEAHLDSVRQLLPETGGASLIRPDVLVLRALASDSFVLRHSLIPILTHLTGEDLPRPWMI